MPHSYASLPTNAQGKIEGDYIFLTRRMRLPKDAIIAVQPTRDNEGAIVITDRGSIHVCESYSALMYYLYQVEVDNDGQ